MLCAQSVSPSLGALQHSIQRESLFPGAQECMLGGRALNGDALSVSLTRLSYLLRGTCAYTGVGFYKSIRAGCQNEPRSCLLDTEKAFLSSSCPKGVIGKDLASERMAALSPGIQRRQLGLNPTGQEGSH